MDQQPPVDASAQTPLTPPETPPAPPEAQERPKSPNIGLIAIVVGLAVVAVVAFVVLRSTSKSGVEKAADTCHLPTTDGGATVVLQFTDTEGFGDWQCMVTNLPIPDYVQQQVGNATAMSGPITQSWDKYTVTASYNGIDKTGSFTIHEN